MFKFTFAVVLTAATTALAGVLYLELPPAYDAGMVYHPTDEDLTQLRDFVSDEIGKLDNEYTCRVIILTKNGKAVLRDFGQQRQQDNASKPTLGHVYFHRGYGWPSDKIWDDLWYHLHEVGAPNYYGVYDLAYNGVFGRAYAYDTGYTPPVIERNVNVNLDPDAPAYGYYLASLEEIYLKDWRAGDAGEDEVVIDTDRAYFTRLMLHAFRGPWPAPYDHFDAGTIHAAWLEIQARLYRDGYETHFNDLGHYEKLPGEWEYCRPYYTYLDNYNVDGLRTSVPSFDASWCALNNIIRRYRYGACGYCWWKVLHHDTDFVKEFNGELCKTWALLWPVRPSYDQLYWAARESYDGGQIEGKDFEDWFAAQPILNIPSEASEYVCAAVTNKDQVEVFNYYRTECNGYPEEFANNADYPGAKILLTKVDWDPSHVYNYQMGNLNEGYGVWSPPMVLDNGKFYVNAEYWELWETGADPEEWQLLAGSQTFGVNTDDAYETDEIFAVVGDAVNGGGWLDVSYNGGNAVRYPVSKYVARIPNFAGGDEAGAGEYELTYVPPSGFNGVVLSHAPIICKDGGCFFDFHGYLSGPDESPIAAAPSPNDAEPPAEAEPDGPRVAVAPPPSPTAGDRPSPTAGFRPPPGAASPEGPDNADVPAGDFPPDGGTTGLYPGSNGGDSLSPGGVAAPFELPGAPAAAASANPLSCSPNPVTGTATIAFTLEEAGRVYLAVYDLSGRRVATLAEGSYAAGSHAASWHADVPTGVYVYRLQAGDRVAVKKVVVAK